MPLESLDIVVSNLDEVLQFFDRIEVHRSTTGISGTYTEITDPNGPLPAILNGTVQGPFTLNGLTLTINLDLSTTPTVITFSGSDPIDLLTVINQINAVVPALASEVPSNTGRLRLTSTITGTGSAIVVTASSAATALGLSTTKVNGFERRLRIVDPTVFYKFFDKDGDDTFWYKTRYSSTQSNVLSSFSTPRRGNITTVVPDANLVQITANLTDGAGNPVVNRRLIYMPVARYNVTSTAFNVIPGFDARVETLTDQAGYSTISLLQNATYRVAIEGTNFIREFVAPGDVGPHDLFSLVGTNPDPFDIVQVPPRPIRS